MSLKHLLMVKPVQPAPHVDAGLIASDGLEGEVVLRRTLGAGHLVMLGIGAVIGAGIFVLTGHAAAEHAGPAVVLSFLLAGIACALAALCYAEFASLIPVSGSAYSYAYATLGEAMAWFIGWNLILEYLFSASAVAVGWSGYFVSLLEAIGIQLPSSLATAPLNMIDGRLTYTGGLVNLPAVAIVTALTVLCYLGIRQSTRVNAIAVIVKVAVILLFVMFAASYVNPDNWVPFIPENQGPDRYGVEGVIRAAAVVFYAYIGFDAVSTAAGEARNPQRDMPIGILVSLAICTLVYIVVAAVLTGLMPYQELGTPRPVVTALESYQELTWLRHLVGIGAITGLSSVILVLLMAQPRIFYSMSRDGLLPKVFGRVHPRYRTPHLGTIIVGTIAALLAGTLPIGLLGELVSMGTLLAFAIVSAGVLILRRTRPDLPRSFRVPAATLLCPLSVLVCLYLFWQPFSAHWPLMVGWTVIGMAIYFLYGYRRSRLQNARRAAEGNDGSSLASS